MFIELMLVILGYFLKLLIIVLPTWNLWPQVVFDAIDFFVIVFAKLNFLFPVDTLFNCIIFLITFISIYYFAKLIIKLINWIRGASGIEI